jgi:hypothetical protein
MIKLAHLSGPLQEIAQEPEAFGKKSGISGICTL